MVTLLYVVYVMVCIFLILVVLLQAGKGGGMGALGGGSQTVFGGSGAGNFLTRLTVISAALFMLLSAALTYVSSSGEQSLERASEKIRLREEARGAASDASKKSDAKKDEAAAAPQSSPDAPEAQAGAADAPAAEGQPVPVIIQKADGTQIQVGDGTTGGGIKVERVDGIGGKPIEAQPVEAPAPAPAQ
jgi:preprotein translocase subunit SecG